MIIVKLQGGLGNQMFQYAAARSLALRTGTELRLNDESWFETSRNRTFLLSYLNIPENILKNRTPWRRLLLYQSFQEASPAYDKRFLELKGNVLLDGYFHSEKYFSDFADTIREEFKLKIIGKKAEEWAEKISKETSVSIHIRRGDYLWEKHMKIIGVLPLEYYERAVEELNKKIQTFKIFVFSDDITWAKENLKLPFPTEFVSDPSLSAPEEMYLISLCNHNIIANSSFSWWGAWLNPHPGKIVIAPKNWFTDKTKNSDDIVSESWIQL